MKAFAFIGFIGTMINVGLMPSVLFIANPNIHPGWVLSFIVLGSFGVSTCIMAARYGIKE